MNPLSEIETLGEAQEIIRKAQYSLAGVNSWAWHRLYHSIGFLEKQQSALCAYHFLETPTVGDFRKVEDAVRGAK